MDKTIISKYIPYFRTFFLLMLIMVHGIPVFAGEGDGGSLATSLLNSENIVTKMTLNNDQQLQGLDFLYSGVSDTDVNRHGRGYRWAGPPPVVGVGGCPTGHHADEVTGGNSLGSSPADSPPLLFLLWSLLLTLGQWHPAWSHTGCH